MFLGQSTNYKDKYDRALLQPIARQNKRQELSIENDKLPFIGVDIWNAYELSWLNHNNKPQLAIAEIVINAESEYIIESKSLKLYLNSFNNSHFTNDQEVLDTINRDLTSAINSKVEIKLFDLDNSIIIDKPSGKCLDDIDLKLEKFNYQPSILTNLDTEVEEKIYTNLFKSNCLVTNQPDWATIIIEYNGKHLDHYKLLSYLIGFRNHNEFHEQCIERIFSDINNNCQLNWLTVYGRFTRRGGIDINPVRSNNPNFRIPQNKRLIRQ